MKRRDESGARLPGGLRRFGWLWPAVALLRATWWTAQLLDSAAMALVYRFAGTRYERTGACVQSGACCELIVLETPVFSLGHPRAFRFFARLAGLLYPFRFERIEGQHAFYSCYNFDPRSRRCLNYRFRPQLCRDYPPVGFFSRPYFFKGCGFSVRLRGRPDSFVAVLDSKRRPSGPPLELAPPPRPDAPQAHRSPS
jgi:Fe-S-cluster containining protein